MHDWSSFRARFPALRNHVYVNAASTSPLPVPVYEVGERFLAGVRDHGDRDFTSWFPRIEEVRRRVAAVFHAQPEEIGFTSGTSHSMSLIAGMLRGAGLSKMVALGNEFPAGPVPFLHQGFELRFVEPRGGVYDLDEIRDAVQPGMALLASQVQFDTGYAADVAALGAICRERGARFVLNATQAVGARPVDFRVADYAAATSHKWMCAGFGAGIFYARREHLERETIPVAGWTSVVDAGAMSNRAAPLRRTASASEMGTYAFDTVLRLGAALDVLGEPGFERIHERIVGLTDRLRAGLRELGISPLTPDDRAIRSGITSFAAGDAEAVVRQLAERNVVASPRRGAVRISLHAYNDESDVEAVLSALQSSSQARA